jgi:hypothetical protein
VAIITTLRLVFVRKKKEKRKEKEKEKFNGWLRLPHQYCKIVIR